MNAPLTNVLATKAVGLELLRQPFPDHLVSQLPKPLKKREEMDKLPKAHCKVCGTYHATSSVLHLSYVGHAALTDRLLEADPGWTWEPLANDDLGLPKLDKDGLLWIKLTVCGVTRMGVGDAAGGKAAGDAMKERIGDALRNAAMRFGAGLEFWHKGDLHLVPEGGPPPIDGEPAGPPSTAELPDIPTYPEDRFEANVEAWKAMIAAGRKTAAAVIKQVESGGYALTDRQKAIVRGEA